MTAASPSSGCAPGHRRPPLQTQDPTETSDTENAPGSTRSIFCIGNGPRAPDLVGDERGTLEGHTENQREDGVRARQVTCTLRCPIHPPVHGPAHTHIRGPAGCGRTRAGGAAGLVRTFSDQGSEGLACDRWLPINLSGGSRCTAGVDLLG